MANTSNFLYVDVIAFFASGQGAIILGRYDSLTVYSNGVSWVIYDYFMYPVWGYWTFGSTSQTIASNATAQLNQFGTTGSVS